MTSDSFRGRPVVVAVWATWCPPCKDELPRIEQEIWRKHRDRQKFAEVIAAVEAQIAR